MDAKTAEGVENQTMFLILRSKIGATHFFSVRRNREANAQLTALACLERNLYKRDLWHLFLAVNWIN